MTKWKVLPEHYQKGYDTKERFVSYWHQINEILKLKPKKLLEVGIGTGFLSEFMRSTGVDVTTLDFKSKLKPDCVGSVLNIPFPNKRFDVVCCFQVLEHLPYVLFRQAVSEIFRVSSTNAVLSLPDSSLACQFYIKVPKLIGIKCLIPIPRFKTKEHRYDGQHYWEIGKKEAPLQRVINDLGRSGFKLELTYRVFEHPYYRFFILKKS